jgi:exoribonuclease II
MPRQRKLTDQYLYQRFLGQFSRKSPEAQAEIIEMLRGIRANKLMHPADVRTPAVPPLIEQAAETTESVQG